MLRASRGRAEGDWDSGAGGLGWWLAGLGGCQEGGNWGMGSGGEGERGRGVGGRGSGVGGRGPEEGLGRGEGPGEGALGGGRGKEVPRGGGEEEEEAWLERLDGKAGGRFRKKKSEKKS